MDSMERIRHLGRKLQPLRARFDRSFAPRLEGIGMHFMRWIRSFNKHDPEVEFYPAALEVVETPPSPLGRAIAAVVIAFFVIALLWAAIATVDIIAIAQGKIIPTGRTKVIQPLEAGVVRAIHVQDGQIVKAGDVLIEIDSTINAAERNRLQAELTTIHLDVARLKTIIDSYTNPKAEFHPPAEASPEQIETQKALLANQLNEAHARLSALDHQIAQNEGNRAAVESTVAKLNGSIPVLEKRAKIHQSLSRKGYGSKLETLTVEQDLIEHQEELKVQQNRLAEAMAGVQSLQEQRKQAEAELQHTQLNALAEAEQKAASLREQLLQAAQKFRLQTLKAPVDGTVQQLAVHTEGGVVTPAQQLLAIVPADSQIEIEAMISNRDIGFVRVGQPVQVKVDAFNFTRYGLLHGTVVSVSRDSIMREKPQDKGAAGRQVGAENDSSELSGQELVYMARIALKEASIQIDNQRVALTPGLAVTAEIKTGDRHIIDYLLSPIMRHSQQALREQ